MIDQAPVAAGLDMPDRDTVGEQRRRGHTARECSFRRGQDRAIEIRLSVVGDVVQVVLAAVARRIEDSADRDRIVGDVGRVRHRQH